MFGSNSSLSELFTFADEIPPHAPVQVSASAVWGAELNDLPPETRKLKADNPHSVLEQVYQWAQGKSPLIEERQVGDCAPYQQQCRITIGGFKTEVVVADNQKAARHQAARNLLLKIIESGEHERFQLPGKTKSEARRFVVQMGNRVLRDRSPTNYVGKNAEYCPKKGIEQQPVYEYEEPDGAAHKPTFRCVARIPGQFEVVADGKTKKDAKAEAARRIFYEFLVLLPDVPKLEKKKGSIESLLYDLCDRVSFDLKIEEQGGSKG